MMDGNEDEASMDVNVSFTSDTSDTGTPASGIVEPSSFAKKNCVKCRVAITSMKECFKCSICGHPTHVTCAQMPVEPKDIPRLQSGKYDFYFACLECRPKVSLIKGNKLLDVEKRVHLATKELDVRHRLAVHERDVYRDQTIETQKQIHDRDRVIQEQTNQMEEKQKIIRERDEAINIALKANSTWQETHKNNQTELMQLTHLVKSLQTRLDAAEASGSRIPTERTRSISHIPPDAESGSSEASGETAIQTQKRRRVGGLKAVRNADAHVDFAEIKTRLEALAVQFAELRNEQFQLKQAIRILSRPAQQDPANTPGSPQIQKSAPSRAQYVFKHNDISYAEALAASTTDTNTLRNIIIAGPPDKQDKLAETLRRDDFCVGLGIKAIVKRGKLGYLLRCDDSNAATLVSGKIAEKYGKDIIINPVTTPQPRIRMVGLQFTGNLHNDEIAEQIREQNAWLLEADFKIIDHYEVTTKNSKYVNAIATCDLETQRLLLDRGTIVFGFSSCKVYEDIRTLQCFKCQRFGHTSRDCNQLDRCKFCAENHESIKCKKKTELPICANCTDANKQGEKYRTRHRSTDQNCQSRSQRIDAIKANLIGPNSKN